MESLVVENGEECEKFSEMTEEESRGSSSSTETSSSEEKQSCGGGSEETSKETPAMGWPMRNSSLSESRVDDEKTHVEEEGKIDKPKHSVSGIESFFLFVLKFQIFVIFISFRLLINM